MKKGSKLKILLTASTLTAIIVAGLTASRESMVKTGYNSRQDEISQTAAGNTTPDRPRENTESRIARAASLMRHLNSQPNYAEEPDIPSHDELTEEEKRENSESAAKWEKAAPIFWDNAEEILAEMLDSEKEDRVWSKKIETEMAVFLGDERFEGTHLNRVECGQTLCRMIIEYDNQSAVDTFRNWGRTTLPINGQQYGATKKGKDGRQLGVDIYFSKSGNRKPFEVMRERMLAYLEE